MNPTADLPQNGTGAAPADGIVATTSRVSITPNQRELGHKFAHLTFNIETGGRAYYEVLLTTDRTLFEPLHAERRGPQNFYSSSGDGHALLSVENGPTKFLVPPEVLHRFAQSKPRPTALFYTMIAYSSAEGRDPTFAHPPQSLAQEAPSVILRGDFTGGAVTRGLGTALGKLRRVGARLDTAPPAPRMLRSPASISPPPVTDAMEREDGAYELGPIASPDRPTPRAYGLAAFEGDHDGEAIGEPEEDEPERAVAAPSQGAAADWDVVAGWGTAQESIFPQGAREPEALESTPDADNFEYDDGWGADSAFEQAAVDEHHGSADHEDFGREAHADAGYTDEAYADEASADEASADEAYDRAAASSYGDEADEMDWDETGLEYGSLAGGDEATTSFDERPGARTVDLDVDEMIDIVERVGDLAGQEYATVRSDPDRGLVFGLVGFDQASGALGRLLVMMRERDATTFDDIFGEARDELIAVTTAADPAARRRPVASHDLAGEAWHRAFEAAGRHAAFQGAQRELAAYLYIRPMLPFARDLGLTSRRALTLLVDRAQALGTDRAQAWIVDAVVPFGPAHLQEALSAVGQTDVSSFQAAIGLEATATWDPRTRAALVAALRGLGAATPVPVPTLPDMLTAVERRASEGPAAARLGRILADPRLSGVRYQIPVQES